MDALWVSNNSGAQEHFKNRNCSHFQEKVNSITPLPRPPFLYYILKIFNHFKKEPYKP